MEKGRFELGKFLRVAFDAIGFGKCLLAAENDNTERDEEEETNNDDRKEIRELLENGKQFDERSNVLFFVEIASGDGSNYTT